MANTGQPYEHKTIWYKDEASKSIKVQCDCGAKWSHGLETPEEMMEQIRLSHIKYFDNKSTTL